MIGEEGDFMLKIHSKTFNPEVLYVFDTINKGPASGKDHHHDFFELSVIMNGETFYVIENETFYLNDQSVLLFNPGVNHMEYITDSMENTQIHIGLRHFNLDRFPRNFLPFDSKIIRLSQYKKAFFDTCWEIIRERQEAKPGYELILKSLVYKLIVYLLRDEEAVTINKKLLSGDNQDKQQLVNEIQLYIENHYADDVTLNQLAQDFYTSPTTLSRIFKEYTGDTPINYLIHYRLKKAKEFIQTDESISIKEVAQQIGYEDPLYFSKLFKKYYGHSPTFFAKESFE